MKEIKHESEPHENAAVELIRVIEAALHAKFGRRMGVGLFVCDFGEIGHLGWAANMEREDAITMLLEWIGTQAPEILLSAVERWKAQGLLGPERTH